MAVRTISTSIKLDGEQEFKRQLQEVNRELRNLDSEMKLATAEFKGQANSVDALQKKQEILKKEYVQQHANMKALEQALKESTEAYGDSDRRTDGYRQSLNKAKAALIDLKGELKDNARYLDEAKRSADGCASSIDEFGKVVQFSAEDFKAGGGGLETLVSGLTNIKGLIAGGAVVAAVAGLKELGSSIMEIEESTREFRSIMGTLEVSSQNAGYNAEQTSYAFEQLYGVLGDTQTAATTLANLQAVGLSQGQLLNMIDATTGAWATYGDSIPIDGLAEAVNETIQAGKVTGTFADVLNWAGTNEDEFNTKLQEANTETERANIVMQELARQGLVEAGQAWRDVNGDVVAANESQLKMEQAWAQLGEVLEPVATFLRENVADAIVWVSEKIQAFLPYVEKAIEFLGRLKETAKTMDPIDEFAGAPQWNGSHAGGLSRVPFDGYVAQLHKDEAVLTANEAALWRQMDAGYTQPGVTRRDLQETVAAAVNALSVGQSGGSVGPVEINLVVNGRKFYQETIEDLRFVEKSNPEARDDA